jgi:hypothetical protein
MDDDEEEEGARMENERESNDEIEDEFQATAEGIQSEMARDEMPAEFVTTLAEELVFLIRRGPMLRRDVPKKSRLVAKISLAFGQWFSSWAPAHADGETGAVPQETDTKARGAFMARWVNWVIRGTLD